MIHLFHCETGMGYPRHEKGNMETGEGESMIVDEKDSVPSIDRLLILEKIGDCLQSIIQWSKLPNSTFWTTQAAEYSIRAQTLIELLEVADCGSRGYLDSAQPDTDFIFTRWDRLYKKFHDPIGKRFSEDLISYEQIKEFFSEGKA